MSEALPRLLTVVFIVMCLILLNLLVAMMGSTYARISEDAKGACCVLWRCGGQAVQRCAVKCVLLAV